MRDQLGFCVLACFLTGVGLVGQQPGAPPAVPPGKKSYHLKSVIGDRVRRTQPNTENRTPNTGVDVLKYESLK